MHNFKIAHIPNLLALDEPVTYKLIKSDYPKCKKNCNYYKYNEKCGGCNNYEYETFWREGKDWKGNKR